jgi:hypothetical protein
MKSFSTGDHTDRRAAHVYRFRQPLFPTEVWNVRQRVLKDEPKSTNSLEAWHRRFGIIVGKSHPNIFEFISKLKTEQSYTECRVDKLYAGDDPLKVKKKNASVPGKAKENQ